VIALVTKLPLILMPAGSSQNRPSAFLASKEAPRQHGTCPDQVEKMTSGVSLMM